jgi:hypothetical protein
MARVTPWRPTRPRTDEYGSPGKYAGKLARTNLLWSAGCLDVALVSSLVTGWVLLSHGVGPAVIPAAVVVLCALATRGYWRSFERAWVGARSERLVARALLGTNPYVLAHGVLLGAGGDADHIVIGPGLVVVETKTGYGRVRIANGKMVAGRREMPGDPVRQAKRQATTLGKRAGHHARAVVCVVNMDNRPFVHNDVTVCSMADLPGVLADAPALFNPPAAYALAARLLGRDAL